MKLIRKAILIGCSNVPPELPGVEEDIQRYFNFLISNNGGAWETGEITISLNNNETELYRKFKPMEDADFAFVLIAGHGEHRIYNHDPNHYKTGTYYCSSDENVILVKNLFPRVLRSVVLVDVCREYKYYKEMKKSISTKLFSMTESAPLLERKDYRAMYDNHILNCPEARVVLYSCSPNQEAADNGDGGAFSKSLLRSVKYDGRGSVITIKNAFDYAKQYVYENHYPQLPIMEAGRGRSFFPFALT